MEILDLIRQGEYRTVARRDGQPVDLERPPVAAFWYFGKFPSAPGVYDSSLLKVSGKHTE